MGSRSTAGMFPRETERESERGVGAEREREREREKEKEKDREFIKVLHKGGSRALHARRARV